MIPVCDEYDLGVLAWSPLAFGMLAGKYTLEGGPEGARMSKLPKEDVMYAWRERMWTEQNFQLIELLKQKAAELETTPVALALNWVLSQELVTSAIIGPRTLEQLEGNWEAITCQVPLELLEDLDDRTAPDENYLDFMQGGVTMRRIEQME